MYVLHRLDEFKLDLNRFISTAILSLRSRFHTANTRTGACKESFKSHRRQPCHPFRICNQYSVSNVHPENRTLATGIDRGSMRNTAYSLGSTNLDRMYESTREMSLAVFNNDNQPSSTDDRWRSYYCIAAKLNEALSPPTVEANTLEGYGTEAETPLARMYFTFTQPAAAKTTRQVESPFPSQACKIHSIFEGECGEKVRRYLTPECRSQC